MTDTPTPDPARKYWWAAGIAVPITVALIGLAGQWHKQGASTAPDATATGVKEATRLRQVQPETFGLNLGGTSWEGTAAVTNPIALQIAFNSDGTALTERGPKWSDGTKIMDHCSWATSAGKITVECGYETIGVRWPDPPFTTRSWRVPRVFVLSVDGLSLKGTMDDGYGPTATVVLSKRG